MCVNFCAETRVDKFFFCAFIIRFYPFTHKFGLEIAIQEHPTLMWKEHQCSSGGSVKGADHSIQNFRSKHYSVLPKKYVVGSIHSLYPDLSIGR